MVRNVQSEFSAVFAFKTVIASILFKLSCKSHKNELLWRQHCKLGIWAMEYTDGLGLLSRWRVDGHAEDFPFFWQYLTWQGTLK